MAKKLRLLWTIRSDFPFLPVVMAEARVYEAKEIAVNPHGAVSVWAGNGWLGVRPDEFEWVDEKVVLNA